MQVLGSVNILFHRVTRGQNSLKSVKHKKAIKAGIKQLITASECNSKTTIGGKGESNLGSRVKDGIYKALKMTKIKQDVMQKAC